MSIRTELESLEPIFHRPEHGTTRQDFERMTDPQFSECGASGRRYSRAFVLDELERRYRKPHEDVWQVSDFDYRELAPAVYLVMYTLAQGERVTRRSTIWQRRANGWCALYHQGTPVSASRA